MKIKKSQILFSLMLTTLILFNSALAHGVWTTINCNAGSVDATATASGDGFSQVTMDLQITGPGYGTYKTGTGYGYASLSGSVAFEYDQYYTAMACAYQDSDDGSWYECDTVSCVTPIEGVSLNKNSSAYTNKYGLTFTNTK